MNKLTQFCSALLVAILIFPDSAVAAQPPAADFFQDSELSSVSISPNGRQVAMRVAKRGARPALVTVNLMTMKSKVLARYPNASVGAVWWLNDKRLALTINNIEKGASGISSGVYAMDPDGTHVIGLDETIVAQRSFAANEDFVPMCLCSKLHGIFPRNTDNLLAQSHYPDGEVVLTEINTRTGEKEFLPAPRGTYEWLVDESGKPRVAMALRNGDRVMYHKPIGNSSWAAVGPKNPPFKPSLYVEDILYIAASAGSDLTSLYRFNLATGAVDSKPLLTSPGFDSVGDPVTDEKKLIGYRLALELQVTVWFDPSMKALQQEIDMLLPDTINVISRGERSETPFVLINAYSPREPFVAMVYNRDTKKITQLGTAMPRLQPAQLAGMDFIRFKARDGMNVPAYLTLPNVPVQKNLPTIVLVGQTPWRRGTTWAFDPVVQFLASRGYAVIQPQVRGLPGFGTAFQEAGRKQWGLRQQDDIADGARWAIAQGIADPARICIAGSAYGGYAALMGVARSPDLFRCAVSWAGIVDIGLMFKNDWAGFDMPSTDLVHQVGNAGADKAQFAATSPLMLAPSIKAPVFLAYGAEDVQVPAAHGRKLYEAIKSGNQQVEFHLYDDKRQDWSLENNRVDMWTKIEKFLEHSIGKP